MADTRAASERERLALPGAALDFWPRIDLGIDPGALMRDLVETCEWRQERITVYGKAYLQPRLSAWYGDLPYRYSGILLEPRPWIPPLRKLLARVETLTGHAFNSVLLNLYRDGDDAMGMHSDDERDLGANPAIASLSLGETRDFVMQHRHRRDLDRFRLPLSAGSLLLMHGETQRNWRHGILKSRRVGGPRLNLTFRRIVPAGGRAARA